MDDTRIKFDERGREIPDPRPLAMPAGLKRPESLSDQIRRLIRVNLAQQAADQGQETFEEANDFDIDDEDGLPYSPYEEREMVPEFLKEKASAEREPAESEDGDSQDAAEASSDADKPRSSGKGSGAGPQKGNSKPARGSGKAARPSQDGDSPDEDLD